MVHILEMMGIGVLGIMLLEVLFVAIMVIISMFKD